MGKMFALIFFLRKLIFCVVEKIAKSQKLEPVKISCHTVSHGTTVGLGLHVANYFPNDAIIKLGIR